MAALSLSAADREQELIAVLQSSAGPVQKCSACQQLRTLGTARSVPALAALLNDERVSQAARHALEAMPAQEAGEALRRALGSTTGPLRAGVIDSLGWRRDQPALALLIPLLEDANPLTAQAAAAALGRIGGKEAAEALLRILPGQGPLQAIVSEGLLEIAERHYAAGHTSEATNIYLRLFHAPLPAAAHWAAWRGLVMTDVARRNELVPRALVSSDRPMRSMAVGVLRECGDPALVQACLPSWDSMPAECQLAVLDAQIALGGNVLPTLVKAAQSPHLDVRLAAWQGMGRAAQASVVPLLASAAAAGEPAERAVARESLARLRGEGVREAVAKGLAGSEPSVRAELLRAVGERGDSALAPLLVEHAASGPLEVRVAALESLRKLAVPETVSPLLDIAARSDSETIQESALQALVAACRAGKDRRDLSRQVIEAIGKYQPTERRRVLSLLAEFGTPQALEVAQAAVRDHDLELAKEGLRVLAQWPNAAPVPQLIEMARRGEDATLRTLALRSCIQVAALESDAARRLSVLQEAIALAGRVEEKHQALAGVGQVVTPQAIAAALGYLDDPALVNEAGLAAVSVAEKLAGSEPALARETAMKVLARCKEGEIVKRAWKLRGQPDVAAPFIREWLVSGPFRQAGVTGAEAAFRIVAGPEKAGAPVTWKPMPKGDSANLAAMFPDQANCVAYLKTLVIAPVDSEALLLLGSDDGVQAWVNGEVVHSNNVDRGQVADQDMAPIRLRKGSNELLLKVSQGGGGWSACARIVGADGAPIKGLLYAMPALPSAP